MSYFQIELNTARNALRYVINAFQIEELYIPYYICPSLRNAVKKENCKIIFYHIDNNFRPVQDFPENAFILYPNYFGICSTIVDELNSKYKNLIVDNAHSFFSEPKGIASFNSLRKFFPTLRDGSFLYTTKLFNFDFIADNFFYDFNKLSYEDTVKVKKTIKDSKGKKTEVEVLNDGTKKLTARRKIMSYLYDLQEVKGEKESKAAFS